MPCAERSLISETVNPDAESYSGPSIVPVLNGAKGDGEGYFTITITNVDGIGFNNLDSFILYEDDAVEDCSTSIDKTERAQIQIFPNPSATQFNIILEEGGLSSYKIYTLTGALVENGNLILSSNQIGENIKSGTYILNIKTKLDSVTQMIIKE